MLASGCATRQTTALIQDKPLAFASSAELTDVPFIPQRQYQCGPAALTMALNWAGAKVMPEQLAPKIFIPGKRGSLQVEMAAAARRYAMLAYVLEPKLSDVLEEVDAGHPVIVFQNLGLDWYPVWHYAVVIGYNLNDKQIMLHSGTEQRRTISLPSFEHTWVRGGSWAMLTLPPGHLPKTAREVRYLRAALALEQTGKLYAAIQAYEAALIRWPRSLVAQMGRGNSYYALDNLKNAEQAFFQATLDHPAAAAAFNNLAQTYSDQKRHQEALNAAQKAVNLNPASSIFRKTLEQIRAHSESGFAPH